jgi:hypothetical protein
MAYKLGTDSSNRDRTKNSPEHDQVGWRWLWDAFHFFGSVGRSAAQYLHIYPSANDITAGKMIQHTM